MGSVSAIDSAIFRSLFGTDEIRKVDSSHPKSMLSRSKQFLTMLQVFDDTAYINRCVDAETTLARVQL
jgi:3-carboxy-cis,cis-muconate cycloisomerase